MDHHSSPSRAVVVVGATSGIGLVTAQQLAARGDRLVLVARDAPRLEAVAAQLRAAGSARGPVEVVVEAGDVAHRPDVERALERCVTAYGRLDAVVTTAQPMAYGTVEQVPAEITRKMVDVAVLGVVHLAQVALPVFRSQGGGHLVVVSSLLAEIAVPSMSAYCTAKWGQLGLVRSLQAEVRRERGVHVSLVLPGAIDTPIYHQAATYAGSRGSAPPPVVAASRVAQACVSCLDRPRRLVHVGPVNRVAVAGFRLAPAVYDRVAPLLVSQVVLRGPSSADDDGNVWAPTPEGEGVSGGWTLAGRLRQRGRARWRRGR